MTGCFIRFNACLFCCPFSPFRDQHYESLRDQLVFASLAVVVVVVVVASL